MSKANKLKVGDELAFVSCFGGVVIRKIDKVTPSGIIRCGHLSLNKHLAIRGNVQFGGPYKVQLATEELRQRAEFQELLNAVHLVVWRGVSLPTLRAVMKLVKCDKQGPCDAET